MAGAGTAHKRRATDAACRPAAPSPPSASSRQVHDRDAKGMLQCSSGGTVNASGTLRLPAGGTAAAAAGDGADGDAADGGWRHVTLDLEGGKAARLTHALEQQLVKVGEVQDRIEARLEGASRQASAAPADIEAAAEAVEGGAAADEQSSAAGGSAAAAGAAEPAPAAGGVPAARQPGAAAGAGSEPAVVGPAGGPGGDSFENVPLEDEQQPDNLVATSVQLRLSWRPMRQPASALPPAADQEEAAAAPAERKLQPAPTFIRLLSGRKEIELQGAAEGGAEEAAAAAEEGRAARQPQKEEAADALEQGLPVEVPLEPLPLHLHAYGHGGKCRLAG